MGAQSKFVLLILTDFQICLHLMILIATNKRIFGLCKKKVFTKLEVMWV